MTSLKPSIKPNQVFTPRPADKVSLRLPVLRRPENMGPGAPQTSDKEKRIKFVKMEQKAHTCIMFRLGGGLCVCKLCGRVGEDLSHKKLAAKYRQTPTLSRWVEQR